MDYKTALEIAGAKIIVYEAFGDYQGRWFAKVEYLGKIGWVHGEYGSCSGCDAFQSEFGYFDEINQELKMRLVEFGVKYLDQMITQDEVLKIAGENSDWDCSADDMVKFIKDNERSE